MKKTVQVEGMQCDHCKRAVEGAVGALAGVTKAQVDLAAKTLTLEYDETRVTDAMIAEAVEDEGFSVK